MAQPRMTEEYHTSRDQLIQALGKWWGKVEEVNHLGAGLLRGLAEQFAQQAGMIEGEIFERCQACNCALPPEGSACENRRCKSLTAAPANDNGGKALSN